MAYYFNKRALYVAVALFLLIIGQGAASGQAAASPDRADCEDTAFASVEKLREKAKREEYAKALELYQRAMHCNPEAAPSLKAARILLSIGILQFTMDKHQEARATFSDALDIFGQIPSKTVSIQEEEAFAAVNLAMTLSLLGQIDQAIALYTQQRELFHRLQDKGKEARILEEIGHASFLMGENQSALESYSQATRILDGPGANDNEIEQQRARISDLRGRVYLAMNEAELARSYFQDALAVARRTNNQIFVASILNDMGMLLLKQHKVAAAESSHQEALNILTRNKKETTDRMAETETLLANCQAASGQYDAAIKNYQHALLLQKGSADLVGQSDTHLSLGLAQSASHQMESALESLNNAAELYHRAHVREGEAGARFEMARIYALRGDNASAKREVMAAIELAEEIRGFVPGPSLRIASFTSLEKMYRFEIDLLLKSQPSISAADQFLAFDLLQRAHSRTLLEALQHGEAGDYLPLDSDVLSRRTELLQQLKEANQKLARQLRNKTSPDVVDQTVVALKRLETSLDQLDAETQFRQPRMAIISPITISVPAIQQELLDEKSALVQFYLSNPLSYAWIITKSGTQLIYLPAKDALEQQVRKAVSFGEAGQWTDAQTRALARLDRSMRPVFGASQSTRWILVPDGALYSFPFALLSITSKTERKIIKVPSASSVRALRSTNAGAHAAYKLAVFADPVFDAEDSRVRGSRVHAQDSQSGPTAHLHQKRQENDNGSYPRLPSTQQEATLISRFVLPEQRKSFMGFAASLDALARNRLSDFKIIHFATHSLVDYRHPELSRIVLSLITKVGTARPGYLLLKDIYRMKLSSDLVVLSSCRAAAGLEGAGEGPMSLSRAFLFAGSRAVLSSVWEADDETTAELMGQFYRHMLKENLSPLDALAKTQSEFRHHPNRRLRNPYYWAGFELYGDWQVP